MDLDIVTDKLFTNLNSLQFQELHILTLKTAFYKKILRLKRKSQQKKRECT